MILGLLHILMIKLAYASAVPPPLMFPTGTHLPPLLMFVPRVKQRWQSPTTSILPAKQNCNFKLHTCCWCRPFTKPNPQHATTANRGLRTIKKNLRLCWYPRPQKSNSLRRKFNSSLRMNTCSIKNRHRAVFLFYQYGNFGTAKYNTCCAFSYQSINDLLVLLFSFRQKNTLAEFVVNRIVDKFNIAFAGMITSIPAAASLVL